MLKKVLRLFFRDNTLTKKFFSIILLLFVLFITLTSKVSAKDSYVSVVIPVRGYDFWETRDNPGEVASEEKELINKEGLKSTFLLRPDIYLDETTFGFFKDNFSEDELGIFFEVTPKLADVAGINYPKGEKADASRFFLSGYSIEKREKLIDEAFGNFKERYGYFPMSVGAWHIDAYSAEYMEKKYGVTAILLVADQYSMDRYRVWGAWWGVPYYPSKENILVPAQSKRDKIDTVVTQWAARDPVNGYGGGLASLYSVQANDYTSTNLGLTTAYFNKLLDIYLGNNPFGHVTIGIENELFKSSKPEFERQLIEVSKRQKEGSLKVVTMKEFSDWYRNSFKGVSVGVKFSAKDPLGMDKKATWIMNNDYRIGLIEEGGKTFVRDFRNYKETLPEPFLLASNLRADLRVETFGPVDTTRNPNSSVDVTGMSEDAIVSKFMPQKGIKFGLKDIWRVLLGLGFLTAVSKMKDKIKIDKKSLLLIILGSVTWSLTMVKSGMLYAFGMGFWGPNGHDGVWHIALAESLAKGSLDMPVFASEALKNYHLGFDLLLAFLHRVTGVPILNLYFQIIPPILALLLGLLTYKFVLAWRGSKAAALWATFFVYFGGSFGWVVTLVKEGFGGESKFWAQQAISTLINPPFALSLVLILAGLIFLQKKKLLFAILIFGILIQIKAYAGILVLGGLFLAGIYEYWSKMTSSNLKVFASSFLISLVLFFALTPSAGGLLFFKPFWFLETMMGLSDRVGWERFYSAMTNYKLAGNWPKLVLAYLTAFAIFIVGNFGTRIIKGFLVFDWIKNPKKVSATEIFLLAIIGAGVVIPMFFLQTGAAWNTIQFTYYSLFFSGILAGVFLGEFLEKSKTKLKGIIAGAVIVLTLPTTLGSLRHYLPQRAPARLPNEELAALGFLSTQPEGIVLTYPFDQQKAKAAESSPPRPLYLYESTAYVAAFSRKPVFLEDEVNLDITRYNWGERKLEVEKFYATANKDVAREFLTKNNIAYVYWLKGQRAYLGEGQLGLVKMFENSSVDIYKVEY